jgi:hypothetical protein
MWLGTSPPGVTSPGRRRVLEEEESPSLNQERREGGAVNVRNNYVDKLKTGGHLYSSTIQDKWIIYTKVNSMVSVSSYPLFFILMSSERPRRP